MTCRDGPTDIVMSPALANVAVKKSVPGRSCSDRPDSAGFEVCNQVFLALRRDDIGDGFCDALSDRENLAPSAEVHRQGFLAVAQPVAFEDVEAPYVLLRRLEPDILRLFIGCQNSPTDALIDRPVLLQERRG